MKEVLLDTDTVSFFLKGIPQVKSKFYDAYAAQGYYNISIMTNNQAHFQRIEGLELDNWV